MRPADRAGSDRRANRHRATGDQVLVPRTPARLGARPDGRARPVEHPASMNRSSVTRTHRPRAHGRVARACALVLATSLAVSLGGARLASAADPFLRRTATVDVVERVGPSVVNITTERMREASLALPPLRARPRIDAGRFLRTLLRRPRRQHRPQPRLGRHLRSRGARPHERTRDREGHPRARRHRRRSGVRRGGGRRRRQQRSCRPAHRDGPEGGPALHATGTLRRPDGRRAGHRHRQPLRPLEFGHHGRDLRDQPVRPRPGRRSSLPRTAPDRRLDQPGQLRRPAAQRRGPPDRHQRRDARRGARASASRSRSTSRCA